ncbi:MAG: D-amino acid dehydrogenase [Burkholderiaceae bacterium]|nr:D-amino acid dehydrogenase [Burkholderiaceae bacterium]
MKVIVLGAGIIGTASAWFLNKAGCEVTVIDRQPGIARETSFANGCQISVSHAEPWANPAAPKKIWNWLGQEDAPLLYRFRPEWLQWKWALQFLRECTPARTQSNIRQILALAAYSQQTLHAVSAETGIAYNNLQRGILHFYTDARDFEKSRAATELVRAMGCPRRTIDTDEAVVLEPALAGMRKRIVGADYTESDESGDVHKFAIGLADHAARAGVEFMFDTQVKRLHSADGELRGVEVVGVDGRPQILEADAYVVALGSFSAPLLRPLGVNLLIYPGKGYSATYRVLDSAAAPTVSLTDDACKLVISRLGDRLRVAGTCELDGYSSTLNATRCAAITRRTRELFPDACDYDAAEYWTGLRPLTPSNIPYIGKTRYRNLFLNTGHGTLGWTMGCGSGRALADIVCGRTPDVSFAFTGPV